VAAQIDDKTCALFFEIITNPQLFVADIRKLADIAHQTGVPLIADTTIRLSIGLEAGEDLLEDIKQSIYFSE
jgi:O-acetylhomoserine/O-acetylserine sulfhydrylase-like pyridoxal-dependent enzyme